MPHPAENDRDLRARPVSCGLLDEDGCLHFLGPDKDMIKVKGLTARAQRFVDGEPEGDA